MEVLLAKERIFKLIQAWDEKEIDSWNLPALLLQLLNDSQTIDEMFKQRKQTTNLAEQEEQADDEEVLQDRENFMKDVQTFLEKFNRYSFEVMPRVLSIAWERISKIKYVFTKPEEIPELMCKLLEHVQNIREELTEYINSPITTILPTEEHEYSLSMGYEHLSTTPETEFDEVIKSSAKNLVPIPSEYEFTSDDENECDVPIKDDYSSVFTTFSNPLFDDNDDFTSSDDESLPDDDVTIEEYNVYSNPLFDDEEINSDEIYPHCFNAESDFVESLSNRDTFIDSSLKFDYHEEFSGVLMPTSIADEKRIMRDHEEYISLMENDSQKEDIDIFTSTDELLPPSIESGYDSEGEIYVLKELLIDYSIPILENESSDFDHHDDSLFPRPPPEPLDVEFFFDVEPDSGELISVMKNNNGELNEDECFDPGFEIDVFTNVEDVDYFPFIFVI
uniref:Reverse transcriptase domain-containing protein n=1 Tax=Tanacetum cinerariifolium TaxID=118510 RepID=A0A6L2MRP0_TANCI|nr:hypothetical protein [Tanacetum cinerariifolium]